MANFDALPPELVLIISENVCPEARDYSHKQDLIALHSVNRKCRSAARPLLFRDIMITFTLHEDLPVQLGDWCPRPWKAPDIVKQLQDSDDISSYVKSLRLRLYPFPVEEWTQENFDDIKERLRVNTGDWAQARPSQVEYMTKMITESDPQSVAERQEFAVTAYSILFLWRCVSPLILWSGAAAAEDLGSPFKPYTHRIDRRKKVSVPEVFPAD